MVWVLTCVRVDGYYFDFVVGFITPFVLRGYCVRGCLCWLACMLLICSLCFDFYFRFVWVVDFLIVLCYNVFLDVV